MDFLEYFEHKDFDLPEDAESKIRQKISYYINDIQENSPSNLLRAQTSSGRLESKSRIYTGYGGKLFTFWKLTHFNSSYYSEFKTLSNLLVNQLPSLESNGPTFFQGKVGILSILAVSTKDYSLISEILNSIPNHFKKFELLYGAAGSLYVLGFILKYWEDIPERVSIISKIQKIANYIVKKSEYSNVLIHKYPSSSGPKYYLGAAHGTIGILHIMLQLKHFFPEHDHLIKNSLDFLISHQLPSGNFPSKLNSDKDDSVHFCHGSVGAVPLLCLAFQEYQKHEYLLSALKAAEDIWKRGALRKGRGLCHGTAGNGYAFLALWKTTQDEKWRERALKFALILAYDQDYQRSVESYEDPQREVKGIPDFPYSLMEGICGTVCFLVDCIQPQHARFPGYDI